MLLAISGPFSKTFVTQNKFCLAMKFGDKDGHATETLCPPKDDRLNDFSVLAAYELINLIFE